MTLTHAYDMHLTDAEYEKLRHAAMRGGLCANMTRRGQDVTFRTKTPHRLAEQLESLIDFGATTAADVMGLPWGGF